MTHPFKILLCGVLLVGCAHSKLDHIQLKAGMEREKVEKLVAETLGTPNDYSPYGNNLRGGVVEYADDTSVLEVNYKSGTPAPWVNNAEGVVEHYPPVDETVISYRVYKKSQMR